MQTHTHIHTHTLSLMQTHPRARAYARRHMHMLQTHPNHTRTGRCLHAHTHTHSHTIYAHMHKQHTHVSYSHMHKQHTHTNIYHTTNLLRAPKITRFVYRYKELLLTDDSLRLHMMVLLTSLNTVHVDSRELIAIDVVNRRSSPRICFANNVNKLRRRR